MATEKRLIDANEVERKIRIAISSWHRDFNSNAPVIARAMEDALQRVIYAPTVDAVEVVHGRWIEWYPPMHMIMTGEEKLYRCSICDAKYPDVEGFNFCPHCGNPIDSKSIYAKLPSNPTVRSYGERDADG